MKEILSPKETNILRAIVNQQNCLNKPDEYPHAKPYTLANLPFGGENNGYDLFGDMPNPNRECTTADIYAISDYGMIKIKSDGAIAPTPLGRAYLKQLVASI